jgi:o-succinylbenzoate synthase
MVRRFSFQMYQRAFVRPLRTARGAWTVREGFIVRVEDDLGVGYGEVAPISEFGTETIEAAGDFLRRLEQSPELAADAVALAALPCCAFAISSAIGALSPLPAVRRDYRVAALLPAGPAAVATAPFKAQHGFEVFKWKIGVEVPEVEQALFSELDRLLPKGATFRLDANGGLSLAELEAWLDFLQRHRDRIEYIEQPLPVGQEVEMAGCAAASGIAIALDESVHGVDGLRWLTPGAWAGPLVIKPALMGDSQQLLERLRPVARQVVFSSVFETQIGVENTLHLADQIPKLNRIFGFDTNGAFADHLCSLRSSVSLDVAGRDVYTPDLIWKQLPHLI